MKNIDKMCSFYVNGWHLVMMILPYISKEIKEKEIEIIVITEEDLQIHVKSILDKLNINEEIKEKIRKLNWNKTNIIENKLEDIEEVEYSSDIFVIGTKEYIKSVNEKIEKINKKITIINCFEVLQFNQNMEEILASHDKVLNTSGIRDIEEIFEGYNNKKVI